MAIGVVACNPWKLEEYLARYTLGYFEGKQGILAKKGLLILWSQVRILHGAPIEPLAPFDVITRTWKMRGQYAEFGIFPKDRNALSGDCTQHASDSFLSVI